MPDVKDVIKGLECCATNRLRREDCEAINCTYLSLEGNGCIHQLIRDALALLKAQEPCEDAVSRKDVINVLQSPCDMRYVNGNWHPCIGDYIEAITNLSAVAPKAQEPRLLTWDELVATDHVYIETNKDGQKYIVPGIVTIVRDTAVIASVRIGARLIDGTIDKDVYGIECRCWTSRPTDAQREAVKWE